MDLSQTPWLEADPPASTKAPIDLSRNAHHASNLLPKLLLERWPPRHELKPDAIVDHGEAAGCQRDALAIDA